MTFRHPTAVAEANAEAQEYFTRNLSDPDAGLKAYGEVLAKLGNAVYSLPEWHPILTCHDWYEGRKPMLTEIDAYKGVDHTQYFVRGFLTCPYSADDADRLVESVNNVKGLQAVRMQSPLYADNAFPVIVEAVEVVLESDGTIRSRDAITWCTQTLVKYATDAQVAETWWNMREELLGRPHGSRSSIFVNQHVGIHMRKILEALNNSGMFGPIKESSLDMLSAKKRQSISETLLKAALREYGKTKESVVTFELRGETCTAEVRDTWNDGYELQITLKVGDMDLYTSGFYYQEKEHLETRDPKGKRNLAEKFL